MRLGKAVPAAAICLLSIAACASQTSLSRTSTAARTSSVTTKDNACSMSRLKITLTYTGALGGQAGGYLRFTNDGHGTCVLTGWPVVAGVTANGKATTFRHAHSTMYGAWQYSSPLPVLTLRPGSSGYAVVVADDLPVGSRTTCPSPDVRLRVGPPGSKNGVLISAWLPGARTYLPTCATISGADSGETSAITTLAALPH
jgi:hypothetical protein